ncbi:MAG: DUF4421 family protein, partial [Candidatus Paceibacterales bacterium]
IILFLLKTSLAQDSSDSIRSKYIQRFPNYFFLWPVIKQRSTSFDVKNQSNQKLTYKPNGNYGLGFGMYIFEIGFEVTFSVAPKPSEQAIYGHSNASDLQLNILGKSFGLDLFTQHYGGFYLTDSNKPVPGGTPYPDRPDISVWNTGMNGIYIFNKNKYSLRAAYNFSERQLRSGGSFILSGTINTFSLRADSAVYGNKYASAFGTTGDFVKLDYTTLSVAPGYAHTLVVNNFFINGSVSIGPANHWLHYESSTMERTEVTLNSFADLRLALGYNSDRFFTGVSFIAQVRNIKFEQLEFTHTNTTFKMVIGYRFKEFGILKYRAWDLLPSKKNKTKKID